MCTSRSCCISYEVTILLQAGVMITAAASTFAVDNSHPKQKLLFSNAHRSAVFRLNETVVILLHPSVCSRLLCC